MHDSRDVGGPDVAHFLGTSTQYFYMNLMYTYGTATFALGGTSGGAWVTQHNTPNIGIFAKITHVLGLSR